MAKKKRITRKKISVGVNKTPPIETIHPIHIGIYRYAPPLIILLMLSVLFYSFFIMPNQGTLISWLKAKIPILTTQNILSNEKSQCIENSTKECKIKNCTGNTRCKNGNWMPCIINMSCSPGSKLPCSVNSCSVGYRICNECGTNYTECLTQ